MLKYVVLMLAFMEEINSELLPLLLIGSIIMFHVKKSTKDDFKFDPGLKLLHMT